MKAVFGWIKDHFIELIVGIAMVAVLTGIGITAYLHRVVEYHDSPAEATVTGTHYEPGHFEAVSRIDTKGKHYLDQEWRPPVCGLQYDVSFEGAVYPHYETVSEETYFMYHTGDTVPATFRREWRADGSETYRIFVN